MADYGLWQGLNQTTGNMLQAGMRLMEYSSRHKERQEALGISQERLKLEQEAGERAQKAHAEQMAEVQRQKEMRRMFVPYGRAIPGAAGNEDVRKLHFDILRKNGYEVDDTNPNLPMISVEGKEFLKNLAKTDADFLAANMDSYRKGAEAKHAAIVQEISELEQSGKVDDKKIPILKQKQMELENVIAGMARGRIDVQAEIEKKKALAEEGAERTEDFGYGQRRFISGPNKGDIVRVPTKGEGGGEGGTPKATKDALFRIDKQIREYEREIKNYQIEARNAKNDTDAKWYQGAIDAREMELLKTKDLRDMVLNGEVAPDKIRWGGSRESGGAPGYTSADAVREAYRAGNITEDQATKILREKFGYK